MAAEFKVDFHKDEIAAALQAICESESFVRSPQLRRLLEYLVGCALAKKQNLKAYTIGVEALGRPDDFDPEQDAIVRVQIMRLRRALGAYYQSAGRRDGIRIGLPPGTYIPVFEVQESASAAPASPARSRKPTLMLACAVVLSILGLGVLSQAPRGTASFGAIRANLFGLSRREPFDGNGLPTIVIRPFQRVTPAGRVASPKYGLRQFIGSVFSRFELVNVTLEPRPGQKAGQAATISKRIVGNSRYDLATLLVPDDRHADLRFQLADSVDDSVVWAAVFEVPDDLTSPATQDKIARKLSATLLQPYGVIVTRERSKLLGPTGGDPRYRCFLTAMDALGRSSEAAYADALSCLERAIRLDPNYSLTYSYLASIYNRSYLYGSDSDSTARSTLERAMRAARRAARINPASARAQYALYLTYFNLHDFNAAETAIARARELNDYDMLMLAEYAGHLLRLGKVEQGMTMLDQADYGFVARACTYGFYSFLGPYLLGNMREAARRAGELTCMSYPYTFVAKALVAAAAGDVDGAKEAIEKVRTLLPIWRTGPRQALKRMFPATEIADRIMHDLAPAGLQPATAPR